MYYVKMEADKWCLSSELDTLSECVLYTSTLINRARNRPDEYPPEWVISCTRIKDGVLEYLYIIDSVEV